MLRIFGLLVGWMLVEKVMVKSIDYGFDRFIVESMHRVLLDVMVK